jgi:integrase
MSPLPHKIRHFSALLFLYQAVLKLPLDDSINAVRAKRSKYLPTVLSKSEVRAVLQETSGVPQLLLKLLYGSGMRLNEGLRLRVKDLDFAHCQIVVRDVKGNEGRVTMLPQSLIDPLQQHLQNVKFCDLFTRRRLRHPHRARTAGTQGREDYDDLHACTQPMRQRRTQPSRLEN